MTHSAKPDAPDTLNGLDTMREMTKHLCAVASLGHQYGEDRLPRRARRALKRSFEAFQALDTELGLHGIDY